MLSGLAFLNPWLLAALVTLPAIYWLLRAVPPRPQQIEFPPTRILAGLADDEKTSETTPWWLTLIRLLAAAFLIFALAEPILNPKQDTAANGTGPVVIVVDNSWAAASHWPDRTRMIERVIDDAEAKSRAVVLVGTANTAKTWSIKIEAPADARSTAAAIVPQPFEPDRLGAATALEQVLTAAPQGSRSIVWLPDGIDHKNDAKAFADKLTALVSGGALTVVEAGAGSEPLGVATLLGRDGKLLAKTSRTDGPARSGTLFAFSTRGERLGEKQFDLAAGATSGEVTFELPLELRNQVARVEVAGERSAGAVSLIDADTQWQRVGLVSGESREQAQPLLAPLYYIQRALAPFAELAVANESNIATGLDAVMRQNVSVLMLADIGTLSGEIEKKVEKFVEQGGVLVRFAGTRLEKGGDDLLPVALRTGGRSLGGALSWSTPQALAAFEDQSIFTGLTPPPDVTISRQVLADPAQMGPDVQVWARLKDGTPLVTAAKRGDGQIVLFHITANSDWSNLPISGLFVDMLRRIALLGKTGSASLSDDAPAEGQSATTAASTSGSQRVLSPIKTLDGFGTLKPAAPSAEPIKLAEVGQIAPSFIHPPGYYGENAKPRALNVLSPKSVLAALPGLPSSAIRMGYESDASMPLKPWLLALAIGLVFADIIAVILLQTGGLGRGLSGVFARRRLARASSIVLAIAFAGLAFTTSHDANAQSADQPAPQAAVPALSPQDAEAMTATGKVTLAYVLTGEAETDEVSRLGLTGLGKVLTTRTTVEPGAPVGINILTDEIAFYPVIYWPVAETAQELPEKSLAKIDAYMKQGGLIVFDTRDYGSGGVNTLPMAGKSGNALQRLLGKLDLPRLEPVPENHVVTKSFYLLRSFPGRWDGGQLWVEAISDSAAEAGRRARVSDGVTSIMITSNDLAAAWALDDRGRPLYATVPGGEMQREMAFRSGVNIVMHALTGNYKADQVHVPALLERLGQ